MLHDAFPVASKRQGMKPDLLPFIDSLINGINRQKDVLVTGHMKNHVWVDGQLRQTNKQFSALKQKQKEQINQWLKEETEAYYSLHQCYPVGRQSEDVVDNVYASIERAGIWIPYGEVYQHYISIKTRLINRLKAKKNANEREAELTAPKDETNC